MGNRKKTVGRSVGTTGLARPTRPTSLTHYWTYFVRGSRVHRTETESLSLGCFSLRFRLPPLLCGFRLRFRRALPLPPSAAPLPPGGRRKAAEALPLPPPSASAPPSLRRATHRPTTRRWRLVELSSAVVGSRGARRAGEVLSAPECSRAEGGSPASAFRFRPASARVFTLPAI